jgi:predicted flap endonuclease-1-like 5' DNA nuclease
MSRWSRFLVLLLVPVVGALVLLIMWWLRWRSEELQQGTRRDELVILAAGARDEVSPEVRTDSRVSAQSERANTEGGAATSDLQLIEGIGPKISAVLVDAGVASFGQLASTDVERLWQVLRDAGIRLAYPDTWPEQAALAASGDWEGLASLQSELYRGRRIP